jgi:hypothetical protein
MKLDVKMVLIYAGGSVLILIGFSLTAIGIFFFYTEGRDLLNYMLHEATGLINVATELRHLFIACVVIAIGLLIGYIGVFILKGHRL